MAGVLFCSTIWDTKLYVFTFNDLFFLIITVKVNKLTYAVNRPFWQQTFWHVSDINSGSLQLAFWHGFLAHLNGTEPSLMLLVTPVLHLFLLCQSEMHVIVLIQSHFPDQPLLARFLTFCASWILWSLLKTGWWSNKFTSAVMIYLLISVAFILSCSHYLLWLSLPSSIYSAQLNLLHRYQCIILLQTYYCDSPKLIK